MSSRRRQDDAVAGRRDREPDAAHAGPVLTVGEHRLVDAVGHLQGPVLDVSGEDHGPLLAGDDDVPARRRHSGRTRVLSAGPDSPRDTHSSAAAELEPS